MYDVFRSGTRVFVPFRFPAGGNFHNLVSVESGMAMTTGPAQINVTPMIDILLVLIIIFMVITPVPPKGLEAAVPQPDTSVHPVIAPSRDVVISIAKDGQLRINQESIEAAELGPRLLALGRMGPHHLFVRGDLDLEFQEVVRVIDIARGAGWDRVGLMR